MTIRYVTQHSVYYLTLPEKGKRGMGTITSNNPTYIGPIKVTPLHTRPWKFYQQHPIGTAMMLTIQPEQGYRKYLVTSPVMDVEVLDETVAKELAQHQVRVEPPPPQS